MDTSAVSLCDLPAAFLRSLVHGLPAYLKLRLRQTCKKLQQLVDASGLRLILPVDACILEKTPDLVSPLLLCAEHLVGLDVTNLIPVHVDAFCSATKLVDMMQQAAAVHSLPALTR